jgi:hypothetical protein
MRCRQLLSGKAQLQQLWALRTVVPTLNCTCAAEGGYATAFCLYIVNFCQCMVKFQVNVCLYLGYICWYIGQFCWLIRFAVNFAHLTFIPPCLALRMLQGELLLTNFKLKYTNVRNFNFKYTNSRQ